MWLLIHAEIMRLKLIHACKTDYRCWLHYCRVLHHTDYFTCYDQHIKSDTKRWKKSPPVRFLNKCPASWTTSQSHNEKTIHGWARPILRMATLRIGCACPCSGFLAMKRMSNGSSIPAVISKNWSSTVMTRSNGNIFRVAGALCGESAGDRSISPHKGQ